MGQSEANIRGLFERAEKAYQQQVLNNAVLVVCCKRLCDRAWLARKGSLLQCCWQGDNAELHVVIFDEIDALCKVHCAPNALAALSMSYSCCAAPKTTAACLVVSRHVALEVVRALGMRGWVSLL